MTESAQIGSHAQPSASSMRENCVSVCAAAARQKSAPVPRAGEYPPRPMTTASPRRLLRPRPRQHFENLCVIHAP